MVISKGVVNPGGSSRHVGNVESLGKRGAGENWRKDPTSVVLIFSQIVSLFIDSFMVLPRRGFLVDDLPGWPSSFEPGRVRPEQ